MLKTANVNHKTAAAAISWFGSDPNIAAAPHPTGIYVDSLRRASRFYSQVRGHDFAKITSPTRHRDHPGMYFGRILVWTEINQKGKWLNLIEEDELPKKLWDQINIPDGAKPNYRVFNYVFDENSHTVYFEGKNEFGESFGPTTGRRLFANLLSEQEVTGGNYDMSVTLIPDETAVDQILDVPRLRKLVIRITRPNPDTTTSSARRRIFDELYEADAKQVEITYTKAAGADNLKPTPNIKHEAELAATDGFVTGFGYDISGRKVELSTDAIPKKFTLSMDSGGSFFARLMAALRGRR
ncbi:hypothetical protein MBLL_03598 [Methylobacterium bullatum]|uniref:Uncharacterized protein n=2 Tax=Methylobacterium bullatum TaxID=570505 RepID=A0A679K0U8_9HYPH|nr:hypothetical protein MBLL_03598 [Methylobacterium bullatum]